MQEDCTTAERFFMIFYHSVIKKFTGLQIAGQVTGCTLMARLQAVVRVLWAYNPFN